ncbi:protein rep, partial [Microcoleus sp. A2-D5]|uniref:protein rep n=1 Tax=Microcoleus sp. A2-D5 TaxID=2818538 RepID=UPI002FD0BF94
VRRGGDPLHRSRVLWRAFVTTSAGPQAPPLENTANNLSADDRRRLRWDRRSLLWKASSLQRVRHCGLVPTSNAGSVTMRCRDSLAGFAGLQHCGSVWSCPVCSSRILVHRALEIGSVLGEAIRQGHPLGFVTLTMHHRKGHALDLLWAAGQKGWQRAISGRGWVAVEELVEGWVRVWEVTEGRNGWHVHVHLVVVLAKGSDAQALELVAGGMFDRWSRGLVAAGLDAPRRVGQDWHLAEGAQAAEQLAEYLAKSVQVGRAGANAEAIANAARVNLADGLGLELTHGMSGRAREGLATRPVWSLLDDLAETGEASALRRWHEWERGSKGKQQVGWSNGLRDRFASTLDEVTDQQIVDQAVGDEHDDVAAWTADEWREFVARPERVAELLEVGERGGRESVHALLIEWGTVCTLIGPKAGGVGGAGASAAGGPAGVHGIGSMRDGP